MKTYVPFISFLKCWRPEMSSRKTPPLSDEAILGRLLDGSLRVDVEAARVFSRKRTRWGALVAREAELVVRTANPRPGRSWEKKRHLFVALKASIGGVLHRKNMPLHKLVWMARHCRVVPAGCEIHHGEAGVEVNAWWNLDCLTKEEHDRLHGRVSMDSEDWT